MPSISRTPSIYQIRHIASGKVYVGSATDPHQRRDGHYRQLDSGTHHSRHLQNAWNKHGKDAFLFEIIEPVLFVEDLIAREQYWIDRLQAADRKHGYNVSPTAGSVLGAKRSDETRMKLSLTSKVFWSDHEQRARQSRQAKANTNAPGVRAKISERQKAYFADPAVRLRLSEQAKQRCADPEYLAKLSERTKACWADPARRAKMSASQKKLWQDPEHHARMVASNNSGGQGKEYRLISPEGELVTVQNLQKFARDNGLKASGFYRIVGGGRRSYKGWKVQKDERGAL